MAWIDQFATIGHLIEGTTQPIPNSRHSPIDPRRRTAGVVATFNSWFELTGTDGGFFNDGHPGLPEHPLKGQRQR